METEIESGRIKLGQNFGWTCPQCRKSHAPTVQHCHCNDRALISPQVMMRLLAQLTAVENNNRTGFALGQPVAINISDLRDVVAALRKPNDN